MEIDVILPQDFANLIWLPTEPIFKYKWTPSEKNEVGEVIRCNVKTTKQYFIYSY